MKVENMQLKDKNQQKSRLSRKKKHDKFKSKSLFEQKSILKKKLNAEDKDSDKGIFKVKKNKKKSFDKNNKDVHTDNAVKKEKTEDEDAEGKKVKKNKQKHFRKSNSDNLIDSTLEKVESEDKNGKKSIFKDKKNKKKPFNKSDKAVQMNNNSEQNKNSNKRKNEDEKDSSPKKIALHQMKFKDRKLMRKQKEKKKFDVAQTLKTYWEDLRRDDCSTEKKSQLLKQICSILKGRVKEFTYAHDTVRVLECVMEKGTEEHRSLIFEEIKDDIVTLSKSKFAKFLVLKVLRYGNKKQKEFVMNAFNGIITKLMKHTEAAEIVETAFNEYANAVQRYQMVQEFYGSSYRHFKEPDIHNLNELLQKKPETKESIIKSMKEELSKVLEKSVVKHSLIHHVLLQFFLNCDPASKSEIIESLREVVPEILHTKDGSRVAMQCVWHGNHKDRKIIIKHMKTFVKKIAMEEHGHMVLLTLFDCVDDTTLVDKIIIKELQESLLEVSQNVHGKKVLIYLLNPRDSHYFQPDVINILKTGDNNEFSKKDPEKRRQELKLAIAEPLTQLIVNNIADLYKDNSFCLFTLTILQHTVGDRRKAFESIAKVASEPYTTENKNVHIIECSGSFFMLKKLILNDIAEQAKEDSLDLVTFSEVLVETIPDGVFKTWFHCNRGAFLLLNLIETEIPAVVNKIKDALMGCHKQLEKIRFKGAELLVKKLKKLPVNI